MSLEEEFYGFSQRMMSEPLSSRGVIDRCNVQRCLKWFHSIDRAREHNVLIVSEHQSFYVTNFDCAVQTTGIPLRLIHIGKRFHSPLALCFPRNTIFGV